MCAADEGHAPAVRLLLEAGASVDAASGDGLTALMEAADSGHASTVEALLEAGASPSTAPERHGKTALLLAAEHGHADVVGQLLAADKSNVDTPGRDSLNALNLASVGGHADVVARLLAAGATPDARCNLGRTALMEASGSGHVPVVRALLDAGADTDARDSERRSALVLATSEYGSMASAVVLVRAGAAVPADFFRKHCRNVGVAEGLVVGGGLRVTRAMVAASPAPPVRAFLESWLAGTHPEQVRRRRAEDSLLALKWAGGDGNERPAQFPPELASLVGSYLLHERASGRSRGASTSSSSSSVGRSVKRRRRG